jgi:WD40 repeat protein
VVGFVDVHEGHDEEEAAPRKSKETGRVPLERPASPPSWRETSFAGPLPEDIVRSRTGRIELLAILGSRGWRSAGAFSALAFLPDRRHLLSLGSRGDLKLRELATGREVATRRTSATTFALSRDGKRALTNDLRLWDLPSLTEAGHWKLTGPDFLAVAFLPDGKRALSGAEEGKKRLALWDVTTGRQLAVWAKDETASAIAVGGDLVASVEHKTVHLRRATGEKLAAFAPLGEEFVGAVALGARGERLLVGAYGGSVALFSLEDPRNPVEVARWKGEGDNRIVKAVGFTPDGKRAVAVDGDELKVLDLATKQVVAFEASAECLAVSPDGKRLAVGTGPYDPRAPHAIRTWELETGAELTPELSGEVNVVALDVPRQRCLFASGCAPRWRDLASGSEVAWEKDTHEARLASADVAEDGRVLSGTRGDIRLWSPEGELLARWKAEDEALLGGIGFLPGGATAVSTGTTSIQVWNVPGGTSRGTWQVKAGDNFTKALAVAPDGSQVVSAHYKGHVFFWATATGKGSGKKTSKCYEQKHVAVSPDGRRAVSAAGYREVTVWDMASHEALGAWEAHDENVGVAFAPGGEVLTVGADRRLALRDATTGKELDSILVDGGPRCLDVRGNLVVIGNEDGTLAVLWLA